MKIETKYNLGQEVWFMFDNKPRTAKVLKIGVQCRNEFTVILYEIKLNNYDVKPFKVEECDIYLSKEELLKSL